MRKGGFLFFVFSCMIISLDAFGQTDVAASDTVQKPKKPLLLTFGLDIKVKSIAGAYNYDYTGEYNNQNPGEQGWQWAHHQTDFRTLLAQADFTDAKLSVMGGTNKVFQAGLSYNFGSIEVTVPQTNYDQVANPGQKTIPVDHSILYVGIALAMEYKYYFNRKYCFGPYAYAGLDLGFYSGSDDVFGPGVPLYGQGKLGLGWNIKKDIMFKAFVATDQLIYRETETSQVFQRPQTLNIDLSTWYIGIGFSKTFTLIPD